MSQTVGPPPIQPKSFRNILPVGFVAGLGVVAATPAPAQWTFQTEVDAITDEVRRTASVVNTQEHSLTVYRVGDKIWATFRLSDGSPDLLSVDRAPVYRVDKREPMDFSDNVSITDADLGLTLYEREPKWFSWQADGDVEDGITGRGLKEMMSGDTLVMRYYLFTGGYKDTYFTLQGAENAITAVFRH